MNPISLFTFKSQLFAIFYFLSFFFTASLAKAGFLPENAFSDDAVGTTTANFLKNPPGARFEALAKGGLVLSGADAIFYNPAGIAYFPYGAGNFSLSYETMIESGYRSNMSYLKGLDSGWVRGFGFLFYSAGEMDEFNAKGDLTGSFSSYDAAIQTTYAKDFEKLKFGINLKFLHSKIYTESARSMAMDIGFIMPDDRSLSNKRTDVAIAVRNLGFPMKIGSISHPLPLELAGGILWHYASNFNVLFEGKLPVDHKPYLLFAGEYEVISFASSKLFLRAGYNFKNQDELGFMGGFSSGFGIQIKNIVLDYAFVPYGDLGDTHKITFSYGFGAQGRKTNYKENIRKAYAPLEKKVLAVLTLKNGENISKIRSFMISNILEAEIIKTKKYTIIQRTDMALVLSEQKLNAIGLTDSADNYLEIGKLIAADRVLIGGMFKKKKSYIITAKIVDVKTGEVLKSESETAIDQYNFRVACKLLVQKLIKE
ncbi:MAG: PorV/PorQ family protein [Elusimicrobia bacterium]|nr:PorV/PorQ family protein [Elusimicrobiota bacterium]